MDMGYLTLRSGVNDEAMESSAKGTEWTRLSDSAVAISCLQMQGTCQVCINSTPRHSYLCGVYVAICGRSKSSYLYYPWHNTHLHCSKEEIQGLSARLQCIPTMYIQSYILRAASQNTALIVVYM